MFVLSFQMAIPYGFATDEEIRETFNQDLFDYMEMLQQEWMWLAKRWAVKNMQVCLQEISENGMGAAKMAWEHG